MKRADIQFKEHKTDEPLVLETIRNYEVWLEAAKELMKWGEFYNAKSLLVEANLHSRILKDQNSFSMSLHLLAEIANLEGNY